MSGPPIRVWTAQSPVSFCPLTISVPHLLMKLMLLPWRWRQQIALISQNKEFFVVMNLPIPWKVEISRKVGWLLTIWGLSCMEVVSRPFVPWKKSMFTCWKFRTHRWFVHAVVQVTSKREALEEKSTGARNDYLLSLAAANAHQTRYFVVDLQSTMQVGCQLVYFVCQWISRCSIWEE